jgi:hypothetical protein
VSETHKTFTATGGNINIAPDPEGNRVLSIPCTDEEGNQVDLRLALDRPAASALGAALVDEPEANW